MSTVVDYVGRKVDVLGFLGAQPVGEVLLDQALADAAIEVPSGEVCAGVQKLAQRWLLEFLTELGSIMFLPLRGCEFMTYVRQGQLRTSLDAEQAFLLSAQTVESNLTAEEDGTMPADERYGSVTLISITIDAGVMTLYMELLSQAGTSRTVLLPIPVR